MAKQISLTDLVESHKPKNFKFFYDIKDEQLIKELEEEQYDILSLNTIGDDGLITAALKSNFTDEYDRESVKKANEPTILDNGVILSKQLCRKTDKKLEKIVKSIFTYNGNHYVAIKSIYARFDIILIFVLC